MGPATSRILGKTAASGADNRLVEKPMSDLAIYRGFTPKRWYFILRIG